MLGLSMEYLRRGERGKIVADGVVDGKNNELVVRPDEKWIKAAVEKRFAEMMAAAGVDTRRAALQVLYYLPDGFVENYELLFDRALKITGESTGGGDEASAGTLGKAPSGTSGSKGNKTQLRGGQGKKYKLYWTILDDDLLDFKHRVDKRLRALGREIQAELLGVGNGGLSEGDGGEKRILGKYCPGKGCSRRLKNEQWRFCQDCGSELLFLDKGRQV